MSSAEQGTSSRRPKINEHRTVFMKLLCLLNNIYYRYTLEVGIAMLDWWEAILVNLYFLLLAYSLAGQVIRNGIGLFGFLSEFLVFLRNKLSISRT